MNWFLVLVYLYNEQAYVETIGKYEDLYTCFYAFEEYEDQVPEVGTQLVCVKGEVDEIRSDD